MAKLVTLFKAKKIGVHLDNYTPGVEKRRGEDVKILTLALRIQPFDPKLATSLDDGLGDAGVKSELFNLSSGDPKPTVTRVGFDLQVPRQELDIFATTDTEKPSRHFSQVKIAGVYCRKQKDVSGWAMCFRASFGPVSKDEQQFVHEWMLTQRFMSFGQSEPSMDFDDDADAEDALPEGPPPLPPMFDDAGEAIDHGEVAPPLPLGEAEVPPSRTIPKRGTRPRTGRHNPDDERRRQREAGRSKVAKFPKKSAKKR